MGHRASSFGGAVRSCALVAVVLSSLAAIEARADGKMNRNAADIRSAETESKYWLEVSDAYAGFVHPGIILTGASLNQIKAYIQAGQEPTASGWEKFRREAGVEGRLDFVPIPVERSSGDDADRIRIFQNSSAALRHALTYAITENEANADKAVEILNAWADGLKSISGFNAELVASVSGFKWAAAADIMKHSYNGWAPADQKKFDVWLRKVYWPALENFKPGYAGNWDASIIAAVLAIGVYLDDRAIFDTGLGYFFNGEGNGSLTHYVHPNGQAQESCRDALKTQFGLERLALASQIAWFQGIDLYSALNHRLARGFEFAAKVASGKSVVAKGCRPRSSRTVLPVFEIANAHYGSVKDLTLRYTGALVARRRPEGGGDRTVNRYAVMGYGSLLFAGLDLRDPTVPVASSNAGGIGDPGVIGPAIPDGGGNANIGGRPNGANVNNGAPPKRRPTATPTRRPTRTPTPAPDVVNDVGGGGNAAPANPKPKPNPAPKPPPAPGQGGGTGGQAPSAQGESPNKVPDLPPFEVPELFFTVIDNTPKQDKIVSLADDVPVLRGQLTESINLQVGFRDADAKANAKRVVMDLDDGTARIDTTTPFTMVEPMEDGFALSTGKHTLKAAAYDGAGKMVAFGKVTFTVED